MGKAIGRGSESKKTVNAADGGAAPVKAIGRGSESKKTVNAADGGAAPVKAIGRGSDRNIALTGRAKEKALQSPFRAGFLNRGFLQKSSVSDGLQVRQIMSNSIILKCGARVIPK